MHHDPYRQVFFEANALDWNAPVPIGKADPRLERAVEAMGLVPGGRVLDVGCVQGRLLPYLKNKVRLGGQVVALDNSPENLDKISADDARWSTVVRAAAENLPFVDNSFDAVIYLSSFSLFLDKEAAAFECFRVLKPQGQAFVVHLVDATDKPPCPFGLNALFIKAGFNRVDFEERPGWFFFAAAKSAPPVFMDGGRA